MLTRQVFRLMASASFLGATVWACSSGTNTGFGNDTSSGNVNSSSSMSSNNGGGNSNTSYGGPGSSTTNGNTSTGGNTSAIVGSSSTAASSSIIGGTTAGCGMPPVACSANPATGAIPLANCFQSMFGSGGYAYPVSDSMKGGGSMACVNTGNLCGSGNTQIGMTIASTGQYAYGSGIGFDLGATPGGGTGTPATITKSSLSFTLSAAVPANGMQVQVTSGGVAYCAEVAAGATGPQTIPWTTFNTLCYNNPPDGGTLPAPATSDTISKILFQVNSGPMTTTWSFCVTALSF